MSRGLIQPQLERSSIGWLTGGKGAIALNKRIITASSTAYPAKIRSIHPWRPSSPSYRQFFAQLAKANAELDEEGNDLPAVLRALVATMRFVDSDPYAVSNELSRPIDISDNAFRDIIAGGKPELLFARRHRKHNAPADLSAHAAHAAMAGAIDALMAAGVPRKEAASYVIQKAKELRLRIARADLTDRQVLRWRDEIGARAPKLAENVYRSQVKKRTEQFPLQRGEEARVEANRFVEGCLKAIRAAGF